MRALRNINISELINDTNHYVNKIFSVEEYWLDEVFIQNEAELTDVYARVCQKFSVDNKWILMVNPPAQAISNLSVKGDVDVNKVLRIDSNKVKVNITNIELALKKGNCAAIVLPENLLTQEQILSLTKSAQRGRTQCIIIKQPILH